jgi:hypothetical protein
VAGQRSLARLDRDSGLRISRLHRLARFCKKTNEPQTDRLSSHTVECIIFTIIDNDNKPFGASFGAITVAITVVFTCNISSRQWWLCCLLLTPLSEVAKPYYFSHGPRAWCPRIETMTKVMGSSAMVLALYWYFLVTGDPCCTNTKPIPWPWSPLLWPWSQYLSPISSNHDYYK